MIGFRLLNYSIVNCYIIEINILIDNFVTASKSPIDLKYWKPKFYIRKYPKLLIDIVIFSVLHFVFGYLPCTHKWITNCLKRPFDRSNGYNRDGCHCYVRIACFCVYLIVLSLLTVSLEPELLMEVHNIVIQKQHH